MGALGRNEGRRLETRHLADSLLFAGAWSRPSPPPRLADLGSGAGLPGLPLAILWPDTRVHLIERRASRADLIRQGVRVLGLENATVQQADAARVRLEVEMVVARAAAPPETVAGWARSLLVPGGMLVVGGSWQEAPAPGPGYELVEVPAWVLDRPVWIRIMAAS